MALEILQRVCPLEASLINDPCVRVKVRLRYELEKFKACNS